MVFYNGTSNFGEVASVRELAQENPTLVTFTQIDAWNVNVLPHGEVAAQILNYRMAKLRRAVSRLESTFARSAAAGFPGETDAR